MMKLSPVWQNYAYLKNQKTVQQVIVQNALEEDFDTSTKGHSVLRRANYSPRRAAGDTYLPEYVPRKLGYESSTEEHSISGAVTNATLATDAFLYDNFDTANRSRGRDQKLLADATAALPPSTLSTPMASSRRSTAALPGRRFLSHAREPSPDISDYPPKTSSYSLPTSHLQASAPPRPNITPSVTKYTKPTSLPATASRIASFKTSFDESSQPSMESSTRLLGGYIPRSIYRAASPAKSGSFSPLYTSPFLRGRKSSFDSGMDSPAYSPTSQGRSTRLLGGYISPKFAYRTSGSPYTSGVHSPALPSFTRPISSPIGGYIKKTLSPTMSSFGSGTQTPVTYSADSPSNSYDTYYINTDDGCPGVTYKIKRPQKVFGSTRRVGNYYDRLRRQRAGKKGSSKYWPYIDVEDINSEAGDMLSDTDSVHDYYVDAADHWDDEDGAVGGTYDTYNDTFKDNYMDEPDEYVPFKPRKRLESPGVFELSPYEDTPTIPDLPLVSRVPYVPNVTSNLGKSSVANDLYLDSLVSSSSALALSTFKNNDWKGYNNASLVLSVEGDVVSPSTGGRYGFKYYHPPVPLIGSGTGRSMMDLPSSSTGDFIGTYLDKLRNIRAGVRNSLDSKISSPSTYSGSGRYRQLASYTPSPYSTSLNSSSGSYLPYTSYRKRLQGGATQRVDVIELPVTERVLPSETLTLTFPDSSPAHDKDKDYYKLTVLDKIKIKAAIVASKVEVEPRKKRPRSKFAADKLRTSRAPVEEAVQRSAPTSGLHASRPPLYQSERKAIRDVDGFTKPRNLLSWQYRMEARTDPVDIIYRPGSFNRMRDQVRNAHDKLDRHRQLLDRYLVEGGSASDVRRRTEDPSSRK